LVPRAVFMPRLSSVAAAPAPAPAVDTASRPKGEPQPAERFALAVDKSPIDGLGVFAAESIPARRKIGEMRGEIVPVREARRRIEGRRRIHVVEVTDKTAIDATKSDCALRHVNHSCAPNAVLRIRQGRAEFYAIRDIAPGEEICADYGESHHEGRLRCRCGAPNCKGRL
jgi:histone-lysine N-methyltransferase SETD1